MIHLGRAETHKIDQRWAQNKRINSMHNNNKSNWAWKLIVNFFLQFGQNEIKRMNTNVHSHTKGALLIDEKLVNIVAHTETINTLSLKRKILQTYSVAYGFTASLL